MVTTDTSTQPTSSPQALATRTSCAGQPCVPGLSEKTGTDIFGQLNKGLRSGCPCHLTLGHGWPTRRPRQVKLSPSLPISIAWLSVSYLDGFEAQHTPRAGKLYILMWLLTHPRSLWLSLFTTNELLTLWKLAPLWCLTCRNLHRPQPRSHTRRAGDAARHVLHQQEMARQGVGVPPSTRRDTAPANALLGITAGLARLFAAASQTNFSFCGRIEGNTWHKKPTARKDK